MKNGYDHSAAHSHAERQERELEALRSELVENSKTILFIARLLGKTLGERDRARDLACRLEAELGRGDD